MSDVFYKDMANIALDIIDEFQQGTIALQRSIPTAAPVDEPWLPGVPQVNTYSVVGVVRSVDRRYVDGTMVLATDRMATVPAYSLPDGVIPQMADMVVVDGTPTTIKKLLKVPEAGITIVYKLILGS